MVDATPLLGYVFSVTSRTQASKRREEDKIGGDWAKLKLDLGQDSGAFHICSYKVSYSLVGLRVSVENG